MGGSHCVVVTSVCDWRTSKGLAREGGGRAGGAEVERRGRGGEEEGEEKRKEDGPFFFFFLNPEQRHSLCILSSFESTYTICSCRLVDILVYVHSSGREHMQRVS